MSTPGPSTWIEQYEALRQNTVEPSPLGMAPMGVILVVERGLAGWMRAWMPLATGSLTPPFPPRVPEEPGWRNELTRLLAQITARHLHPAS